MRFMLPLPLPRRQVRLSAGRRRLSFCCPLSHLLVVVANTLQLAMMVVFLCMLLVRLNQGDSPGPLSWFAVFSPLWTSDAITLTTGSHELIRILRARPEAFASRRNVLIAQIGRLKGSVCVTVFKFLLAMRQDGLWPELSVLVACSPYFAAAILRLLLHFAKRPVLPPDGSAGRAMRPGTPFNPVHPVILMIAFRADGYNQLSWAATFWPLWAVFGLLAIASIASTVLAVGICAAREPPDHGQRALFFLCYAFLLTVTTTGLTFLVALSAHLDGNVDVSYTLVVSPLIVGYALLLLFYLVFTIFLPPLLLRDLNAAALDEEEAAEDESALSGVIEAVSNQLAPPVLVQVSSTLFRRMGNSAMFERFMPGLPGIAPAAAPAAALVAAPAPTVPPAVELGSDIEAGGGGGGGAPPSPAATAGGHGNGHGGSDEYESLEKDIEQWVRITQEQQIAARHVRKPRSRRSAATAPMPPDATAVPPDVRRKLRRLIALKEQLAAAACAEACGAAAGMPPGKISSRCAAASAVTNPMALAGARPSAVVSFACQASAGGESGTPTAPARAGGADAAVVVDGSASTNGDGGDADGMRVEPCTPGDSAAAPLGESTTTDLEVSSLDASPPPAVLEAGEEAAGEAAGEATGEAAGEAEGAGEKDCSEGRGSGGEGGVELTSMSDDAAPRTPPPPLAVGGSSVDGGLDMDDDDDDEALCDICFTGPRDAVLLECGHGGICYACARRCLRKKGRECPLCRAPVVQIVQLRLEGTPSSPQHTGVVRVKQLDLPEEIDLEGDE